VVPVSTSAALARGQRINSNTYFVGSVESLKKTDQNTRRHLIRPNGLKSSTWKRPTDGGGSYVAVYCVLAAVYFDRAVWPVCYGGAGGKGVILSGAESSFFFASKLPEDVNVSFKDVAGCQQAKMEIMSLSTLKNVLYR
jgi:ATP-dependent Zn protease